MHRRWLLRLLLLQVCALLLACASGPRSAPLDAPLDVMTFNIRYGTAPDSADAWPNRRSLLFDVIREEAPHVLGVQEALRFQLDELRQTFNRMGEAGVGRDDGQQQGEYAAILYDTRRLELLEQGTFWFSPTPEVPGSKGWGNNITRIATWARFRDLLTTGIFYVYNVHWDHESQASRDSSALLLLRRVAAREHAEDPTVVMGDFNAGETNTAFRTLLSGGARVPGAPRLIDTFRARNPSAIRVGTYHAFKGGTEGEKIDAILVGPAWNVIQSAIVNTSAGGRYPSDHYPVTARIARRLP